jgi:L-lactate dehydrogenase complex protein LldG
MLSFIYETLIVYKGGTAIMEKVCKDWSIAFDPELVNPNYWNEFEENAKAASAEIWQVNSYAEAAQAITTLIQTTKAQKVIAVGNEESNGLASVYDSLKSLDINLYTNKFAIAENASTADIGISTAEFAVGETGSVCVDSYSYESRIVGMLPPIHIVFLDRSCTVENMTTAFKVISRVFNKGYMGFITGPSRTADIERVLSLGVHGPSRFIIIAVDEAANGGKN